MNFVLQLRIALVVIGLNEAERKKFNDAGFVHDPDVWVASTKKKFIHINCGTSGAFMVEKETGELYNIQGYGRPDRNKKKKADLGNIKDVDPKWLHTKRHNYLR